MPTDPQLWVANTHIKMEQRKYKTLEAYFRASGAEALTYADFKVGFAYSPALGVSVGMSFPAAEVERAYALFAEAVCATKVAREKYKVLLKRMHWINMPHIMARVVIAKRGEKLVGVYNAGQDYSREIRCVQSILRRYGTQ